MLRSIFSVLFVFSIMPVLFTQEESSSTVDEALIAKLNMHYKKGDFEKAIQVLDEIILTQTDSLEISELHTTKGVIFEDMKEFEAAIQSYSAAISFAPSSSHGYNYRGVLFDNLSEPELARADFNKAIAFADTITEVAAYIVNRATTWSSVRNFKAAYDDLMQAYAIDSSSLSVLTNLGAVTDELGKKDEAVYYLKRGIELYPENDGLVINLGFIYSNYEDFEEAIKCFDKVLDTNPKEPFSLNNRGYCYFKLGKHAKALKDINASLVEYPSNAYAFRNRALVYIAKEDFEKACEDISYGLYYNFTMHYGNELEVLSNQYCSQ